MLEYLGTGDSRYREQFADDRVDFEEFKARYDRLIDTKKGKEQGERLESLYEEYVALGEGMMDRAAEHHAHSPPSDRNPAHRSPMPRCLLACPPQPGQGRDSEKR